MILMARVGALLSRAALVFALIVVLSIVLLAVLPSEVELIWNRTIDEIIVDVSFLAGMLAPLCGGLGLAATKASGVPAPRIAKIALAAGVVALVWPVLFYFAFANCPGGVC